MSRKISAGDTIEARCTKCRALLNHTIVAMVEERVVRVECNTCRGMHNYHPVKEQQVREPKRASAASPAGKKEAAPRKTKKDPALADREEWEELQPGMQRERAVPYAMTGKYRAGDLLDHGTFGLGVVKLLVSPNKIEVLFQAGKKLLYAAGK